MKRLLLAAAILLGVVVPAFAQDTQHLFVIERSANMNVVHYVAQLTKEGTLDPREPVIAYWIMLANGGHREDLNLVEKHLAYGFTIRPDPSGRFYRMALAADKEREIKVYQAAGDVKAEMVIDGHPAILQRLYVSSTETGILPSVNYVELFGHDIVTGEKRYEKLTPRR
jgi:hypothetical protein